MNERLVTWRQLWDEATARVGRPQARWLCEVASGFDGDDFVGQPASQRGVAHLDAMLARIDAGEPLQYVLGRWGFRHIDVMVDRRVLIPRPETETVTAVAIDRARRMGGDVLCADLGTGSGAIGLSLAFELADAGVRVWMTDRSAAALDVARANATGIGRAAANVRVAEGDWFDALPADLAGAFDVVVSNPPYVADDDADLDAVVREWEPGEALFAGPDGLEHLRRLIAEAPSWLRPGGWLVLEIGASQGAAVSRLLDDAGFDQVEILPDAAGRDRVAVGRRP
jgi:release factor glutamine methyltransferase